MPRSMWVKASRFVRFFCRLQNRAATAAAEEYPATLLPAFVVDAGHGGRTAGLCVDPGPPEKVVTLDVATRLSRKLRIPNSMSS